jgi:16S rRNA (uracil1498-N3)-methyltransferase
MPVDRYYIKSPLEEGQTIQIEGPEFHHLIHVMRATKGDSLEIVNGCGVLAEGTLQLIEKKQAIIQIEKVIKKALPSFQIILALAIPRSNRLDFILEKGTEIGMTELWLFPGQRSERKTFSDHQLERMEAVIISAMKQSGRLDLPLIKVHENLKKWSSLPYPAFFGDLSPLADSFEKTWNKNPPQNGILFFIGPESGLNEQEIHILQKLGAKGVNLHHNILRTDTAALATLVLINHYSSYLT